MTENQNPEEIHIPETIEDLVASLREREADRRRAVDLKLQEYDNAQTDEERNIAARHYLEMLGILDDFRAYFPEVFPPDSENR